MTVGELRVWLDDKEVPDDADVVIEQNPNEPAPVKSRMYLRPEIYGVNWLILADY